jgi:hypothetical protein
LGENNIVINAPQGLALSSGDGEPTNIALDNLSATGDIEFRTRIDLTGFDSEIRFSSDSEVFSILKFEGDNIVFGDYAEAWDSAGWKGDANDNEVLVTFSGNTAAVYINGQLLASNYVSFSSLKKVEITNVSRNSSGADYGCEFRTPIY